MRGHDEPAFLSVPPGGVVSGAGRILVVGGDPGAVQMGRRSLERAGYDVRTAASLEEAFARIEHDETDLVVVYHRLPGEMSGLDFHARLYARGRGLPVILLADRCDESTVREALPAGVRDLVIGSDAYPLDLAEVVGSALYRARTTRFREENEQRLKALFERSPDAVFSLDPGGNVLAANAAARRMVGHGAGGFSGRRFASLVVSEERGRALEHLRKAAGGDPQEYETAFSTKGGRRIELSVVVAPIFVAGEVVGIYAIARDTTEQKALQERLVQQSLHDPLTGLPNRALFMDRLGRVLARGGSVAVLYLDLDDFKVVNDSLKHDVGDALLVKVGQRIADGLRSTDTAARLGGDEFTVLLEDVGSVEEAVNAAGRIAERLREPFEVGGHTIFVAASIGIALNGSPRDRPADLLRNADIAMYRAKRNNRARHEIFDPRRDAAALERLAVENDLRLAVEREELVLHYQPLFSLEAGRVIAMEALLRWEHPARGLLSPARFIPLAEETGLIIPLGRWVIREACRQAREWCAEDPDMIVGVNLSLRQFRHPGLVDDVARALRETGLESRSLALEITESVAMHDADATVATLEKLKALGVWLVIDDFGTGNSSPAYLTRRFNMDHLKIDGSLVRGYVEDPENSALVTGLIGLAHGMGLRVIAEGVETAGQLRRLGEMGCEYVQGYHISRPLPAGAATELLLDRLEVSGSGGQPSERTRDQ